MSLSSKLFSFVFFLTPSYLVKVLLFTRGAGVGVKLAAKSSGLKIFPFFFKKNIKVIFMKFVEAFLKIVGNC